MHTMLRRSHALLLAGALLLSASPAGVTGAAATTPQTGSRAINPPGIAPLVPVYSVAIRAGDHVFVSAMTGVKPGTQEIVDGGIEAQTRQALENLRASLEPAGATMADVVDCTVFLTDISDFAAMNEIYATFFPTDPPARAVVAVTALPRPTARVAIKCSAVIRPPRPDAG